MVMDVQGEDLEWVIKWRREEEIKESGIWGRAAKQRDI